jgi:hypothetical protein
MQNALISFSVLLFVVLGACLAFAVARILSPITRKLTLITLVSAPAVAMYALILFVLPPDGYGRLCGFLLISMTGVVPFAVWATIVLTIYYSARARLRNRVKSGDL